MIYCNFVHFIACRNRDWLLISNLTAKLFYTPPKDCKALPMLFVGLNPIRWLFIMLLTFVPAHGFTQQFIDVGQLKFFLDASAREHDA